MRLIITTLRYVLLLGTVSLLLACHGKKIVREPNSDVSQVLTQQTAGVQLSAAELDQLNIDVRLLLAENCYKCHNSVKHKAALVLDTQAGIFEGGENGPILTIGNSNESEIIRRLRLSSRNEDAMPPEGKRLSRENVDLIALWIDQGAHWADTTLKLFRDAPLALNKPELPAPTADLNHPIDLLVDKYFKANGIRWPKTIADHRFIRKAYLDVIGLLPTPSQITTFIDNQAENKYEKLVDELLLDQNNYTLHWFSFWNDLLRNDYSGTGYIDGGRKQISDWLYEALKDDKPYDQIVSELINPDSMSEGFIKGIQWRGAVNASQRTELQAAQNISQSLLGLNLKCASCHNSFVNNVSLEQAYEFANIFADTSLQIYQCDKPTGKYVTANFIYPELGMVAGEDLKERLTSLSEIIVTPENGRLYRTLVNRYWDKLFGRGLVVPVDDMDQLPWSQDLLDWLACNFIDHDYSFKALLRTILTSKTYRLEPISYSSPEVLKESDYIFEGPVPRRLSAEQFIDAFTSGIYPFYSGAYYTQHTPDGDPEWVWHREIEVGRTVLPKPGERWFRNKFYLNNFQEITEAIIIISVDSSFKLFINEQEITSGSDWRSVIKKPIPVELLERQNCIAIQAVNDGQIANPAGLLMTLEIKYPDQTTYVVSDKSWVSTDTIPTGSWKNFHFIDTSWSAVRSYGATGYWGYLPEFNLSDTIPTPVRAALMQKDQFMLALGRPSRENVTTQRSEDATLLQAMTLSNDELLADNIRRGARKWQAQASGNAEADLKDLFYRMLGRNPNNKEMEILISELAIKKSGQEPWEDIIWAITMLPEFHLI